MPVPLPSAALPRYLLLYAALYAAFGVASPFLPAFLQSKGLAAEEIGVVLAAATGIRLITGPCAGRLADRLAAPRGVLTACVALSAVAVVLFLPAGGFGALLAVSLLHAAALAPTTTIADALALGAAAQRNGFEYGWVRGAGSAAFIIGSIAAAQAIDATGLAVIICLQAALLAAAAGCVVLVPDQVSHPTGEHLQGDPPRSDPPRSGRDARAPAIGALIALPEFRRLVLIAALVLGSHAMHDAFAVIRWSAGGIGPATASLLWSESVAAEVAVFLLVGPWLIRRLGPAGAMILAAAAGVVRWSVMAVTADIVALALVQPLHGLTFALLHLACMRVLARVVPAGLAATAQSLYATGIGATTAILILVSGELYGRFGPAGFWAMAALCIVALPLPLTLRRGRSVDRPEGRAQ
jgi:PPP family 3-phenylpropionic acid transporter